MTDLPWIVAGCARSGSSLVMQMLDRGGVSCFGEFPAYEDPRTANLHNQTWLQPGRAHKVLCPPLLRDAPPPQALYVWMERNATQQARSQVKFMRAMGVSALVSGANLERVAESIRRDNQTFRDAVRADRLLVIRFEDLLRSPEATAKSISQFLGAGDPAAMAAAVIPREPECFDGLLEARLIQEEGARRA